MEFTFNGFKDYPINVVVWDEVKDAKAVVQISHGMAEYIARYDEFAKFLNKNGYIVIGDDHRGHGKTRGDAKLGIVPEGDSYFDTIEDMALLTKYAKEKYNLPVILFGHSYGSFLSQGYIEKYSNEIVACILCGSARMDTFEAKFGQIVTNIQHALFGKDKEGKLINKLSFGMYEKPFKSEKRKFAWGSRDVESCEKYNKDENCQGILSLGFYKGFFNGLAKIYKNEPLKIRKDLPIFIISGDKDPVGGMGKLVSNLHKMYVDFGFDAKIKLYEGARHELTNEINKEEVFNDVLAFLDANNK